MGKKAQGKHKAAYERQRAITARHKSAQLSKRAKKLAFWISKGVKKNGKPVLTVEQRKARLVNRKVLREEAKVEARKKARQQDQEWQQHDRGFRGKKQFKSNPKLDKEEA